MLTVPAKFSANQNRLGGTFATIVKVTDGTSTWYFSDREINFSAQHIPGILKSISSINESVDIYSRRWAVSDVKVTLHNVGYGKDSSFDELRPEVTLANIRWHEASIYLLAGEGATSLSDCLLRFTGIIDTPPIITSTTFKFTIADGGRLLNRKIAANLVSTAYGAYPEAAEGEKMPIVYGDFTFDTSYDLSGTGLAMAVPVNRHRTGFVVSDHPLNALTELYAKDVDAPDLVKFLERTLTADDANNRGTATAVKNYVTSVLFPDNIDADDYDDDPPDPPVDWADACDRDLTSSCDIEDISDEGLLMFGFAAENLLNRIASYNAVNYRVYKFSIHCDKNDSVSYLADGFYMRLYYASYDSTDYYDEQIYVLGNESWEESAAWDQLPTETPSSWSEDNSGVTGLEDLTPSGTYTGKEDCTFTVEIDSTGTPNSFKWRKNNEDWITGKSCAVAQALSDGVTVTFGASTGHTLADQWVITCVASKPKNLPYMFGVFCQASNMNGETVLLTINELRLLVKYVLRASGPYAWAACEGRKYGSWISSRSSNYSSGAMIEDPAGIIESILRDEFSLASDDIALTSFIDAENTSVKARLNLHSKNDLTLNEAIRQLAEQSTFAFFWSAANKARLIPLNDSSPTTNRTIPWSHIKKGEIKCGKTVNVINKLNVESRWHAEADVFRDSDTYEDATSQTAIGRTITYDAEWPNISGTSAAHVGTFLVNSTNGIWSKEHNVIEFETVGFANADLEIGDWIELDDDTVDPHRLLFGSSWSGVQFLVTSIRQGIESTKITAIELY